MLKLKLEVDPVELRKYGFKLGREFFGKEEWCGNGIGYEYMSLWYHKFATYEGTDQIIYSGDEDEYNRVPQVHIMIKTGDDNSIYIDCAPDCTYHIGGDELDIVTDTLYDLMQAGLIEKV